MVLDVLRAARQHADALGWFPLKEAEDEVLGSIRYIGGELDVPVLVDNAPHDNHGVVRLRGGERLASGQEDVHEDAEAPPVDTVVVAVCQNIFRRHIARGATEGVGALAILQHLEEGVRGNGKVSRIA